MNLHTPFARKMAYLVGIMLLLPVLSWLAQPASSQRPGGRIAQERARAGLSQASLGEIDPASETMKLATLGMRGVAVNLLWSKVLHYQKVKDFTSLSATLEQIAKLQPNFIRVWIFQGWNLSYNISVEFDDYHDRYHWVIRGIDFVQEGLKYNRDEPTLMREIGRTVSQKIGRADERVQFRRLFRQDDDFHGARPVGERDNWLVGKEWFERAVTAVETGGKRMKSGIGSQGEAEGASPLIYLSEAPLCQIYYAATMEEEGTFDQAASAAWGRAEQDWLSYGDKPIEIVTGVTTRMSMYDDYVRESDTAKAKIAELAPGVEKRLEAEKRAGLSEEERQALDTPFSDREGAQYQLADQALQKIRVMPLEIAAHAPPETRAQALKLAADQMRYEDLKATINTSRDIVNYVYWLNRCRAEQTEEALAARRLFFEGQQAQNEVELEKARAAYEAGFVQWRKLLDNERFALLIKDGMTGADLVDVVQHYRRCLKELDEEFPEDFILADVLKEHEPPSPTTTPSTDAGQDTPPPENKQTQE